MSEYKIVKLPAGTVDFAGDTTKQDRYRLYFRPFRFWPWDWIGFSHDTEEQARNAINAHRNRSNVKRPPPVEVWRSRP